MEIVFENIKKVIRNKKRLENKLHVSLTIEGNKVTISGSEEDVFTASRVLEAINSNFAYEIALELFDPETMIEKLNLKDLTRRKNLREIKARVIGTRARTIELISELSNCRITLQGSIITIIGRSEDMKNVINALTSLVRGGARQSYIYSYLERQRRIPHPDDLGLKEEFKRMKGKI
jgi:rRNA processing protein Krr1/Pno1